MIKTPSRVSANDHILSRLPPGSAGLVPPITWPRRIEPAPLIQCPGWNPQFLGHGLGRAIAVQRQFHGVALVGFVELEPGRCPASIPVCLLHEILSFAQTGRPRVQRCLAASCGKLIAPVLGSDLTAYSSRVGRVSTKSRQSQTLRHLRRRMAERRRLVGRCHYRRDL